MPSKLLRKVFKAENLERSWQVIRENGRQSSSDDTRREISAFADDAAGNIRRLQRRLSTGKFTFAPPRGVVIAKRDQRGNLTGKVRPIVLAPIENRIVQRALLNVLLEVPRLKAFSRTPYSFGGVRKEKDTQGPQAESLSAVPAAIRAVLDEIGKGAKFSIVADIFRLLHKNPEG